jgi:hypothetical protein
MPFEPLSQKEVQRDEREEDQDVLRDVGHVKKAARGQEQVGPISFRQEVVRDRDYRKKDCK